MATTVIYFTAGDAKIDVDGAVSDVAKVIANSNGGLCELKAAKSGPSAADHDESIYVKAENVAYLFQKREMRSASF
jgi:hypothetical protein